MREYGHFKTHHTSCPVAFVRGVFPLTLPHGIWFPAVDLFHNNWPRFQQGWGGTVPFFTGPQFPQLREWRGQVKCVFLVSLTNKFGIKRVWAVILSYCTWKQHLFSSSLGSIFFKVKPGMRQIYPARLPHTYTQIAFSAKFKMQPLQSGAYYPSQHCALTQMSGHHYI